jgi:hypothetical protein
MLLDCGSNGAQLVILTGSNYRRNFPRVMDSIYLTMLVSGYHVVLYKGQDQTGIQTRLDVGDIQRCRVPTSGIGWLSAAVYSNN